MAISPLATSPSIVGLSIEEVEISAAIYEDMRQAGVVDDQVDDRGEMSQLWNVVGVILSVECDHSF